MDTDLNKANWESRMFQFFAGDLYEVLPLVQSKFYATEPVTGVCKATTGGLRVYKSGLDVFNVTLHFDCELNIQKQKVLGFAVGLESTIEGVPRASSLDFRVRNFQELVTFYPYGDYKTLNEPLARELLRHSLRRLEFVPCFGSGWPLSPPRDYPNFMTEDNVTVVYDSTHVDPHQAR